jgi:hypothetical protein
MTYGGVVAQTHIFLTSALAGSELEGAWRQEKIEWR